MHDKCIWPSSAELNTPKPVRQNFRTSVFTEVKQFSALGAGDSAQPVVLLS
jgi:hypothetical protein